MKITSVNNELVKQTAKLQQKKYRTQSGKFLLEGFKAIKEAFYEGIKLEYIFVDEKHSDDYNFAKNILIITTESVLKKLAATDSAPGAIAVGYQKIYDKNVLKSAKKVVLLENIKDLGNLGTIIRSAVAFGADAIILFGGENVDIYNPKSVRASVGNLWKIPVLEIKDLEILQAYFKNFSRIATLPRANNFLKDFKTEFPCLIMFGSEADGLSEELINFSTASVKIEMAQTVESLNLATAAAVVMYEVFNE